MLVPNKIKGFLMTGSDIMSMARIVLTNREGLICRTNRERLQKRLLEFNFNLMKTSSL